MWWSGICTEDSTNFEEVTGEKELNLNSSCLYSAHFVWSWLFYQCFWCSEVTWDRTFVLQNWANIYCLYDWINSRPSWTYVLVTVNNPEQKCTLVIVQPATNFEQLEKFHVKTKPDGTCWVGQCTRWQTSTAHVTGFNGSHQVENYTWKLFNSDFIDMEKQTTM